MSAVLTEFNGPGFNCHYRLDNSNPRVLITDRQHDATRVDGACRAAFMPFCYVEAATKLPTNPAIDPYGKIPEFKYCAVRFGR